MQFQPNQIYPPQNFNQQGVPNNQQYNQGFPPQPPVNMNQMQQVDISLAGGFGDMFFNMNDPRIAQTNVPVKQDSSMHTATIFMTIIMIGGIIVGNPWCGFGRRRGNGAPPVWLTLRHRLPLRQIRCAVPRPHRRFHRLHREWRAERLPPAIDE